ncbi:MULTISPECIES: aldehyde dehydrogenase family protein [Paenibacillus]|uniref:aldehyde dehydrogenase family protein n=1 Tax=Paenibacillus TaxID=44249 RepID=UPI00056657C0|nr:hypothetical protein A3958_08910 [Paenibacillus glucanolyticus]
MLDSRREGNIVTPAIFGNVFPDSRLAQTEYFSPIVSIIKAASDEDAIKIANNTEFGLSSAIFTADLEKGSSWQLIWSLV